MDAVFFIPKDKYAGVKEKLLADDIVSRQSIDFRDNNALGLSKDGYYLKLSGSEEAIERAKEIMKDEGEELKGSEREEVLKKFSEQEDNAAAGFGSIFG